ncbi:MAG: lipopolysaccharide heptosyltransferase II [Lentisphaerae bacterium RIFOXYA12_FULL_60_10]|nr:MAG: lipopolysaccharide heptosyltransferase II [Lentisphaerae bacterium RIFOXYA12_FULL_60_10]
MNGPLLISSVNWLGDAVMTLPALTAYRTSYPDSPVTLLIKPAMTSFWSLVDPGLDQVVMEAGLIGQVRSALRLRQRRYVRAFILPNSFRSAWIPFLAGIPLRRGVRGHFRSIMFTHVVDLPPVRMHQAYEYFHIMGLEMPRDPLLLPRLHIPAHAVTRASEWMRGSNHWIGMIPGAARGPSKRWPAESFIDAGRQLIHRTNASLLLLGTVAESMLCGQIATGIGPRALNLAGKTTLIDLAAVLGRCRVVVANDSGGMHLAAAVGCRLVALFGITDPVRTGPLGNGHVVIQPPGVQADRKIARQSVQARDVLHRIHPDQVVGAVLAHLQSRDANFLG